MSDLRHWCADETGDDFGRTIENGFGQGGDDAWQRMEAIKDDEWSETRSGARLDSPAAQKNISQKTRF